MIKTLDEFEEQYRKGLGRPLDPGPFRQVTEDWLERFAVGAGDFNPLFQDSRYAANAGRHGLTASPMFLFSVDFGANGSIWGHIPESDVSMQDITLLYLGASIEWHRPIWVGDRVRGIETPTDVRRTTMRQIGEALICTGTTEYRNSRDELIAVLRNDMLRFPNPGKGVEATDQRTVHAGVAPDPLVWARTRRGGEPRYWEQVTEGEELPELPKGSYTQSELYLFALAALRPHRNRQVAEGTLDMGAGGRADPEYARRSRAQAGIFDYGPQRLCWLGQIVTDWMGDHGVLLRLDGRLRRPNLVGDVNTVRASVTRVHNGPEGEGLIDVAAEVVNHEGTTTATATATVCLPREGSIEEPRYREGRRRGGGIYN